MGCHDNNIDALFLSRFQAILRGIAHLMKPVAQRPDHVEVLLNLAVFYDRQRDADHRALYMDMGTQIDPESRTKYEALKTF
jgi:hypothetical protein